MKLRVLGSGSSGNSYLLEAENETLILECGLNMKDILKGLNYDLSKVVGCLVTHSHKDHSKAVKDIIKMGVDVYSSKETFNTLELKGHRLKPIEPLQQFKVGGYVILPFSTQHDCEGSLGFLIQHENTKILFITDSYYCKYKFKGINHILIECNYSKDILQQNIKDGIVPVALCKRLMKSHFSLEHVEDFLQAIDLSQAEDILLIHLSDNNSNAKQFINEIEGLTGVPTYVADKGMVLGL